MERQLQNPHCAELAYRWYWATYTHVMERRDEFRHSQRADDFQYSKWRYKGNQLNGEIYACYDITIYAQDEDEAPTGERQVRIDYVIQLFKNTRVQCVIRLWDDRYTFEEHCSIVRARLDEFCSRTFLLCKCNEPGIKRLGNQCVDCFVYHHKRTDNDRCPICLEDEGRWVQLPCSHILHTFCWQRVPGSQCPICRASIDVHALRQNYPFSIADS